LLVVWHLLRPLIGKETSDAKAIFGVLDQLIKLHLIITGEAVESKIIPQANKLHVLSMLVQSQTAVDVNLKLFDVLGRVAMMGLWLHWVAHFDQQQVSKEVEAKITECIQHGFNLIQNNPILFSPLCDQQAIEVALFLMLASLGNSGEAISSWLGEIVDRLDFTVRTHGRYPTVIAKKPPPEASLFHC